MPFEHQFLDTVPEMEQITRPDGRVYRFDGKEYMSVTTMLGQMLNTEEHIQKWRARVGVKEANRITSQASYNGNVIHNICEQYMLNNPNYLKGEGVTPLQVNAFSKIKKVLDRNVDLVYGVEHMLYSDTYKAAGMSDLICRYRGLNCIVDFKNARKPKKLEWITGYLYQSSLYGHMVEEMYGLRMDGIVIIIAVEHDDVQVFQKIRAPIMKQFDKEWHEWRKVITQ